LDFGTPHKRNKRSGISTTVLAVVIVVVLILAGVGAFFALSTDHASTVSTSSQAKSSISTVAATRSSTASASSSAGSRGVTTYSGTFNFTLPLDGPSGVRTFSNGTTQYYNSTQVGSGTFSFFIAALNESGSGSGQGTLTLTTKGFCSGTVTFPYTFKVTDATLLLKGNLTVFFGMELPVNYTVPLTCVGSMTGATQVNNPWPYLPEFPGEFSVATVPASAIGHSGNFTWGYSVKAD
jgi:uncharacterized protein (UPF0333 family)